MVCMPPKKRRITVYSCQWDLRAQIPQQWMNTPAPEPDLPERRGQRETCSIYLLHLGL